MIFLLLTDGKIDGAKRTLLNRMYVLKQEIEVFKFEFPNEYNNFMEEIKRMEQSYLTSLAESTKPLTFEIDPEKDTKKIIRIDKLEATIRKFIDSEVKFRIISKKLQTLIVKLNLVYNTSIFHSNDSEKKKIIQRIEQAENVENNIIQEFKECSAVLNNKQLKDELVTYISYLDYEIFKTKLRNTNTTPEFVIQGLAIIVEFKEFDYASSFKAFVQDELSNLNQLVCLINSNEYGNSYKKQISKLLQSITYTSNVKSLILDSSFWNEIFILESSILKTLRLDGIEKDKTKVQLIERMNIRVLENEVLTSPKTNAHLSLMRIFTTTQDDRVFLLIKLLENLSDEITYKEIYFLLQLFDTIQVVKNTPNGLSRYMEKYLLKYPYDRRTIAKKKEQVRTSLTEKNYVIMFNSDEGDEDNQDDESNYQIAQILENLKMDYKIENGNVYISSFYFIGLENVLKSLQENTNQTI